MAQKAKATTSSVIFCFQTCPGVDSMNIIKAGPAKIKGQVKPVKPSGKGYYGIKMTPGDTVDFNLFDTDYKIRCESNVVLEVNRPDEFPITSWQKLGPENKLPGTQRRLQILGYYPSRVDNKNGKITEHAALGFQADNKLRTDGEVGPKTRDKLKKVIKKKNKSKKTLIVRRTLVRFLRSPDKDDPEVWSGNPDGSGPDLDDRGFIKVKSFGFKLPGPVLTIKRNSACRIKVLREFISNDALLEAVSSDEDVVKVKNTVLPKQKHINLELQAQAMTDGKAKTAAISIMYKKDKDSVEIGKLQVIVMPNITRLVRPVWITINGTAPGAVGDKAGFRQAFRVVNTVWKPYGVYFHFLGWREKAVTGFATAGKVSSVGGGLKTEFNKMSNAKDTSNRNTEQNKINLYIVNDMSGAYGITYDAIDFSWPNGIALKKNDNWTKTGIDLAHELGHFIGLADCVTANKCVHAEDDPDDNHKKKDIWSLRRLMYGGWPASDRTEGFAHNVGYGHGQYGCVVSVRNLPQDKPDNELQNGRKHMLSNKFYKK